MGLAADSHVLAVELRSKGITDTSCAEGFEAWEHVSKYDIGHAVVTRARLLDAEDPVPIPLVAEIARWRAAPGVSAGLGRAQDAGSSSAHKAAKPASGPELKTYLATKIRECIASVLHIDDIEDIDVRARVSELGVDSVMTVSLRHKLQIVLGHKVPPTLTWSHPTVGHLVEWFYGRKDEVGG